MSTKNQIIKRNAEKLERFVKTSRVENLFDTEVYAVDRPRIKGDTYLMDDDKWYTSLWICYNSDTGVPGVPKLGGENGTHTIVHARYTKIVPVKTKDGKEKRAYVLELNDPHAKDELAIRAAISDPGNILDPELQKAQIDTVKVESAGNESQEISDLVHPVLNVVAQRVYGITKEIRDDLVKTWGGECNIRALPTYPEQFGTRLGDEVMLDSIIEFNLKESKGE